LAKKLLLQTTGDSIRPGEEKKVKNFEQWTEELSKQVSVQTDEENMKVLYKPKEVVVEDDFEEEDS